MKLSDQQIHLQYPWQCPLGNTPTGRRRNVRLLLGPMPYSLDEISGHFSNLPYRNAHRLENRDPDSISGAWGISFWRSERMYGNVPHKYIEDVLPFTDVTPELWNNARAFRKLCYYRVTTASEAIRLLNAGREVRYACEVNYAGIGGSESGVSLQERDKKQQDPDNNCTMVWETDGSMEWKSKAEFVVRLEANVDPKTLGAGTNLSANSDRTSVTVDSRSIPLEAVQAVRVHLSSKEAKNVAE